MSSSVTVTQEMPSTGIRMAMAVVGVVPIMVLYPFFQKYFVKGIAIGGCKRMIRSFFGVTKWGSVLCGALPFCVICPDGRCVPSKVKSETIAGQSREMSGESRSSDGKGIFPHPMTKALDFICLKC